MDEGRLSDSQVADLIEIDVLIPYRKAEQRFTAQLKRLPAEAQPQGQLILQHMHHQAKSWQLWIEAIRENNPAKATQSHVEQERANELNKLGGSSE